MHWGSDFFLVDMHTCKWIILAILDQMANGLGSVVVPQLPVHGWEVISTVIIFLPQKRTVVV